MSAVIITEVAKPEFKCEEIIEILPSYYSPKQYKMAKFISEYYFSSLGEALNLFTPFSKEFEYLNESFSATSEIKLSNEQQKAFEFLQTHTPSLLFGDTGSGKSEIYMSYFHKVLSEGKRVIFLMPEISLTPQMFHRLEVHFKKSVVMWHSKLTKVQKRKALQKIHEGSAKIIAGARSALFLPVNDLGLIVVDEEHDDSYKASSRPRYNARDMAIYMAKLYDIPVVLGSATPSLTSYVKFEHYRLKGGFYESQRKFTFEPFTEEITPLIEDRLAEVSQKKEQAIVFIPTRAHFKYLICSSCGFSFECPFCSVGMSLHHYSRTLKCHYCNYTQKIPQVCPQCHEARLESHRLGTAEAIDRFKEILPSMKFQAFDRDTITTQAKLVKILNSFNSADIDVLVGTQMLSKGHDYHDVTLAIIMGIDNILKQSDYRAHEKALSLMIQIAGRSGRKKESEVIVQTFNKEFFKNYLGRYELFLEDEKDFRKELYPPYKKLARLLFAHNKQQSAKEVMLKVVSFLKNSSIEGVEIVGSGASSVEKIAGKYRFEIFLRSEKSKPLLQIIKQSREAFKNLFEVDMDPIDFS